MRRNIMYWTKFLFVIGFFGVSHCQIPSFGACPNYEPMANFDKDQFLGKWYESERLFTVTELASRCIAVNYEKRQDGQIWVENFITNRFTGVQRRISGNLKMIGKSGEAKYSVNYNSLPINYDTTLNVLDTDYKTFAIIYSCSPIGPVGHTQSLWLMTRERNAGGPILQRAYGILDKYKITRTFFIKTDQADCEILPPAEEAVDQPVDEKVDQNVDQNIEQTESNTTLSPDS